MATMVKVKTVLLLICFFVLKVSIAQDTFYFKKGLSASGVHRYGREALYSDKLAYQLFTNTLKKPVEGETMSINNNRGEAPVLDRKSVV